MTTRTVVLQRTELRCRAEHPLARRVPRFKGHLHGLLLQRVPFLTEPTGQIRANEDGIAPDCICVYCSDCKLYSEYRIVQPTEAVA